HDLYLGPTLPDLLDDADQVLEQPGRRVDVRGPQQSQQGMIATENVQGQITILVIVAVKAAAELMAMKGIGGGVDIEHDALRRHEVLREEGLHEVGLHRVEMGDDLFVTAGGVSPNRSEFQAI